MSRPRPRRRSPGLLLGLVLLALAAPGCTATPLPDPPSLDEVDVEPRSTSTGEEARIAGAPDAVEPELVVHAVNLDSTDPPARTTAGPSGAFEIALPADSGDVVRLQARDGDRRSEPVDVRVADGPAERVPPLLGDCLRVPRDVDLGDRAGVHVIDLANECDEAVELGGARFRVPVEGLSIRTEPPATLAPASEATLELELAAAASREPIEGVLFVDVTSPSAGRRAITLHAVRPEGGR